MKLAGALLLLLCVNAAYLAAFPAANLFYVANILAHLGLGLALGCWALFRWGREWRGMFAVAIPAIVAAIAGAAVAITGASSHQWLLWLHIIASVVASVILLARLPATWQWLRNGLLATGVTAAVTIAGARYFRTDERIINPASPPLSMQGEGAGPASPFFPSSAQTADGKLIPSSYFVDSAACGECHKDAYEQWKSSMHHFASFNNPFYRRSIEYMQDATGTQPSKWCAGCHDHAMLFSGKFEKPASGQIETPEAQAGLGCVSCHGITSVASTMGNGGFTLEYPSLHALASSRNRYLKALSRYITYINPEPHKRSFLKPFVRMDSSEFCSACHKVHLDAPVNNYRWIRGFNDYDNWQASGVSGQGARSFYYPAKSSTCADCHMPRVPSADPGGHDGMIHSHRFAAANTAVPFVNGDAKQLAETEVFLKSGFITVDLFAVSPLDALDPTVAPPSASEPRLMSSTPVGEESEDSAARAFREVGEMAAPLGSIQATVAAESTVRVDIVVRTRSVGHFFPGGTLDAFDVWLDVSAKDADGREFFRSGGVSADGAIDPGAHFYRSFQLDAQGNPIDKRNAWQTRSVLYARAIGPGSADVAHYRIDIPARIKGPITMEAALRHRKFSLPYTRFVYNKEATVPKLPIVTLSNSTAQLDVGVPRWTAATSAKDRERWNDWGIGLLLQGDLKGAQFAFKKVTEAEPGYADGWLNVARALIQEGETEAARLFLDKATALGPELGRVHYFRALVEKAAGNYDQALALLQRVERQFPRDRVVLNQIARILFLKRDYAGSLEALRRVASVDPEDLQMHYTAMLSLRGLGRVDEAKREQTLFERFKAEEASQALTAKRRLQSPEDNNERQSIHDHGNELAQRNR